MEYVDMSHYKNSEINYIFIIYVWDDNIPVQDETRSYIRGERGAEREAVKQS